MINFSCIFPLLTMFACRKKKRCRSFSSFISLFFISLLIFFWSKIAHFITAVHFLINFASSALSETVYCATAWLIFASICLQLQRFSLRYFPEQEHCRVLKLLSPHWQPYNFARLPPYLDVRIPLFRWVFQLLLLLSMAIAASDAFSYCAQAQSILPLSLLFHQFRQFCFCSPGKPYQHTERAAIVRSDYTLVDNAFTSA